MGEFEDFKQCRGRVSREYIRGQGMYPKVGLIFVHICGGLGTPRQKSVVVSFTYFFIKPLLTVFNCLETLVYFVFCVVCLRSNAIAYVDENLANFFSP